MNASEENGQPAAGLPTLGRNALWCPGCNAKSTHKAGQAATTCRHCQTPLLPEDDATAQARHQWLEEQHRRIRWERRMTLLMQSVGYFSGGRGCLLFFVVAGLCSLGLLALFGMLAADERTLTVAILTAGAAAFSVRSLAGFQRCRGDRWPQLRELVSGHGGRPLSKFRDVLAWLNIKWPSYYSPFFLSRSTTTGYAALTYDGVPVMINVQLEPRDLLKTSRLHLLLATPLENVHDAAPDKIAWTDEARQAGSRLLELGFLAEVWESGVALLATPDSVREFRVRGIKADRLEDALAQGVVIIAALNGR